MMEKMGKRAREAARILGISPHSQRSQALHLIADALRRDQAAILAANEEDLKNAQDIGTAMQDRLRLTPERLKGIADAVMEVRELPDPLNEVQLEDTRPNGLHIRRVTVPLGVLAVIYEARPNVTVDAAAMALKSGNAILLRGGKEAIRSNMALVDLIRLALMAAGLPEDCVHLVEDTSRESAKKLMQLDGYVDLLIPRGGPALIRSALENAAMPVLQTGEGVCHVYVDKAADLDMAVQVVVNAKANRPSTCNAAESLLIHQDIYDTALPLIGQALLDAGVELRGDARAVKLLPGVKPAQQEDWGQEYNALIMTVKAVEDIGQAIKHIARYGTKHSEAILTQDEGAKERFFREVDAAAVYHNASTRFTDGGEFGFGAEIGISTQKMHCRGPVGIKALCSYKYLIGGKGQVRT